MHNTAIRNILLTAAFLAAVPVSQAQLAPATDEELASEANEISRILLQRLGEGYTSQIDSRRRVVFITSLDAETSRMAVRVIRTHLDALRKTGFDQPFGRNLTILLPTVRDYRKLVAGKNPEASGFYSRKLRLMATISLSNAIVHELVHAVHDNQQMILGQDHPIWIAEGLATLYQNSEIREGRLVPKIGPELAFLKESVEANKIFRLGDLLKIDRAGFMAQSQISYPQVRYLMYYLHQKQLLDTWYDAYRTGYDEDPTGLAALEKVLGKDLEKIEDDWLAWIDKTDPPWQSKMVTKAHLGIRMKPGEEGVIVDAPLSGTSAGNARLLKSDDVILSIGGLATPTPQDLSAAVVTFRPGQTVRIELVRDGQTMVVDHVLGAIRVNSR
ncbi:MAG: PDZ domain-containing protein [Phycisphaerae bacterium]